VRASQLRKLSRVKIRHTHLAIAIGIVAVAVRLIAINQPYVDNWSWRQSDVAAIARNFYTNGFHFARPQIDWAGDAPGYVGTEFPILPFVAAIAYKFLGVHDWIGRGQTLILFAASLPFFFLLVREVFGGVTATWALFFYSLAPLNVFAGREFMPDVPSLSLAIIGLYFFLRWMDNGKTGLFIAAAIVISLSILIKATSAVIGAPLLCLALAASLRLPRRSLLAKAGRGVAANHTATERRGYSSSDSYRPPLHFLAIFAVITLIPAAIWYWYAYEVAQKFYPHHFFGAGGIQIMSASWYWKIAKQIMTASLTPMLVVLAIVGAFVTRSTRRALLFHWWLAAMVVFIVIVGYGNRHQWYQLPLVPITAALAGAGCASAGSKISTNQEMNAALSVTVAILFGALAFAYARPLYQSPSSVALRDLGLELNHMTPKNSLIAAADNGDPTVFYYAERKGWHFPEREGIYNGEPRESARAIAELERLRSRGAGYVAFTKDTVWWLDYYGAFAQYLDENATLLETTPEFKIYQLKTAETPP